MQEISPEPSKLTLTMCKFCRHHTSVHDLSGCQAEKCTCGQPDGEPSLLIGGRK